MAAPAAIHATPAPSPSQRAGRAFVVALQAALPALVTAVVEIVVLRAYMSDRIGWLGLVLSHAAVVALLAAWTWQVARASGDCAMPLLLTIAVAAAGPVGALAGLAVVVLTARRGDDPKLLQDWYQRIALAAETDDVTRLCEQVATGRTASLAGAAPASFVAIMQSGSLDERQAALGLVARNFHPDYLPVLVLALKSPEPVIRVQAAAVATRCRADLRALVDRHARGLDPRDGSAALSAAAELDAAIASGLLDEGDSIRAGVVAARLKAHGAAAAVRRPLVAIPILDRQASEAMLIAQRRFADLRVARRLAAVSDGGRYRVRRPGRGVAPAAVGRS